MPQVYSFRQIDPTTGACIDTDDDQMDETALDAALANALETTIDRDGSTIYRFAEGWYMVLSEWIEDEPFVKDRGIYTRRYL